MEQYEFTIFIPVFNEEENLERVKAEMKKYLAGCSVKAKVLFVNDGSSDRSQEIIETLCEEEAHFEYVSLSKNMGLSAAMKAAIDECDTSLFGYIDADLQTNPEDFEKLLEHIKDHQLVTGIRANRKDSFVKKMSSKVANAIRRSVTNDGMEDTGCPLKIMRSDYAKKIPFFKGMHRFLPALILLQEGTVKQVPVRHYPRIAGEAKYGLLNRLWGPLMDTFALGWMKKRYINYEIGKRS